MQISIFFFSKPQSFQAFVSYFYGVLMIFLSLGEQKDEMIVMNDVTTVRNRLEIIYKTVFKKS